MEKQLDEIESGKLNHIDMLKKFYPEFKKELNKAYVHHGCELCKKCDSPMILRTSKAGESYQACSAFPACRNTKSIIKNN